MRLSIYKNDKHEKHITCATITGAFTWISEKYGTNTGMIEHKKATSKEQEMWNIPIGENVITIINLDS